MPVIVGILLISYIFGITPILLGIAYNRILRIEKAEISDAFFKGMCLNFALFAAEAILFIKMGKRLSALSQIWLLSVVAVSVIALVIAARKLPTYGKAMMEYFRILFIHAPEKDHVSTFVVHRVAYFSAVILMILSIFVTRPLPEATVEYASVAVSTDEMYYFHPYLGTPAPEQQVGQRYAPVEMLYAAIAQLTGIEAATVVRVWMPLFLILFFYAAWFQMAQMVYEKDADNRRKKAIFRLCTILVFTIPIFAFQPYIGWAIYLNPWNGVALLNSVLLPYLVVYCLKNGYKFQNLCTMAVITVACQLTYVRGGVYAAMVIAIFALMRIGCRLWKKGGRV